MTTTTPETLYTFAEAAEKLGVPERRISLFAKGNLVEVTDGNKISESALADLLERRKREQAEFEYIATHQDELRRNTLLELAGVDSATAAKFGF